MTDWAEPIADTPVYEEPTSDATAWGEPIADTTVVAETVADSPTWTEQQGN